MDSEQVHPLQINKSTPKASPTKMLSGVPRPLSEISPAEQRRNSPSWRHSAPPKKAGLSNDSSPFQSSPMEAKASPRLFWQSRNAENIPYGGGPPSPSPQRRSSIERLQRASRVKNSNILALEQKQEYDPTRIPTIERPLSKVQGNAFSLSQDSPAQRSADSSPQLPDFASSDYSGKLSFSMMSPGKLNVPELTTDSSSTPRTPASPTKSALSPTKFKDFFDPETGSWSAHTSYNEDNFASGTSSHRHVKSVTFDAAPPQVNEYEMATPDISTITTSSREGSYDSIEDDGEDGPFDMGVRGDVDESFDASLEDTDKTPVVGPDDWRADSPAVHRGEDLEQYEASPMPEGSPSLAIPNRSQRASQDTVTASGEHRPLPPVPGVSHSGNQSTNTVSPSPGLSSTAERMLHSPQRNLPTPPPAATSKADIQNFGNSSMTLEERLKLMMLSDDKDGKTAAELQRERRLRRGNGRDRTASPQVNGGDEFQDEDTLADLSVLGDFQMPEKISRESIMRRVHGNKAHDRPSDFNFSSPAGSPAPSPGKSQTRELPLDPDVPIPSTENLNNIGQSDDEQIDDEDSVIITRDDHEYDDVLDFYDEVSLDEDEEEDELALKKTTSHKKDTPVPELPALEKSKAAEAKTHIAHTIIPEPKVERPLSTDLQSYMASLGKEDMKRSASPPKMKEQPKEEIPAPAEERPATPEKRVSKPEYDGTGWGEDDEYEDIEPGTPDSVIHHDLEDDFAPRRESPAIPEQMATIKASGSKLKTRASNTPSDLAAMREARRQASYETPIIPPIPDKHKNRISRDASSLEDELASAAADRRASFKSRGLTLDIDAGLSLDQDFERVIEAQKVVDAYPSPSKSARFRQVPEAVPLPPLKDRQANHGQRIQRGYLMRQNTKLITASDKDGEDRKTRSVNNSPVKEGRPESWTIEPWNGQMRRKSTKRGQAPGGLAASASGKQSLTASHAADDDAVTENGALDGNERGRLFVKVMGVKDLDLPISKTERTWFNLTLDNGVHCVTTSWLELARNAPIGQEFELVVPNDLEFQLTLNVKLEKPAYLRNLPPGAKPGKAGKTKTSTFSKVFASPKKRKEIELREREEERIAQQQREAMVRQKNGNPSAYELLSPIVAEDGSFARSYVCLKEHESHCYGRPHTAEIVCFNEWASEDEGFAHSVKSKRGNGAVVRRAPYKIGKLELQLLFVPRPKNVTDDDMPKSMNSCIREMKAAEERLARSYEGHLSQQGGDCPYWRRRYFKLVGPRLTAFHEATRQPRATINLGNAKRLIDDRRSLTEKDTTGKSGRRRRSAFAEEEEGYMFVEEGFRIRFNNGEVIDFYADTAADKEGWMRILSDVIGRGSNSADDDSARSKSKWCDLVLKKEDQLRRRSSHRSHARSKSTLT